MGACKRSFDSYSTLAFMLKKIIILGTGGNCIDILDTINEINRASRSKKYLCAGFLDDNTQTWGKEYCGVKTLGGLDTACQYTDCYFVNGIGSPGNFWKKDRIIEKTGVPDERFETIIHPSASVSSFSQLDRGVVVFQNATITSNVRIGRHVIILPNTVISHDDVIGDYTCVAGGVCVSGGVVIGPSCYLGTNATLIGNITIGAYCLIGMGSVVLDSVEENSVVAGNPARFLRRTRPDGSSSGP
jgi:sugar O-acyltransferase (sialic acid O-acetyltransferase NeuD family)